MQETIPQSRPLRIFLIEDSSMDINLFKIALARRNSTTELTTFNDGKEALSHIHRTIEEAKSPDLIILDLGLSGMDGIEVLEECKKDGAIKSTPIIIFTSTRSSDAIDRCYAMGAAKVVSKPIDLNPFLGTVQNIEDCLRRRVDGHGNLGQCIESPN